MGETKSDCLYLEQQCRARLNTYYYEGIIILKEASGQDGEKAWRVNSTTASLCSTLVIADLGCRGAMPNGRVVAVPYGTLPWALAHQISLSNRCHNTRETSHGFSNEISRFRSVTQQDMVFQIKPVERHDAGTKV